MAREVLSDATVEPNPGVTIYLRWIDAHSYSADAAALVVAIPPVPVVAPLATATAYVWGQDADGESKAHNAALSAQQAAEMAAAGAAQAAAKSIQTITVPPPKPATDLGGCISFASQVFKEHPNTYDVLQMATDAAPVGKQSGTTFRLPGVHADLFTVCSSRSMQVCTDNVQHLVRQLRDGGADVATYDSQTLELLASTR